MPESDWSKLVFHLIKDFCDFISFLLDNTLSINVTLPKDFLYDRYSHYIIQKAIETLKLVKFSPIYFSHSMAIRSKMHSTKRCLASLDGEKIRFRNCLLG